MDVKLLMRRAAEEKTQTISSPLARVDAAGRIVCRVCNRSISHPALWTPHCASAEHVKAVAALKAAPPPILGAAAAAGKPAPVPTAVKPASALNPIPTALAAQRAPEVSGPATSSHLNMTAAAAQRAARAAATLVPGPVLLAIASSASSTAPAATPAGFFDDVATDLKARGIDPVALAAAAKASEWAEFQAFASEVAETEAAAALEESERYAERSELAAIENELYRGRVDIARFVKAKFAGRGADATANSSVTGGPSRSSEVEAASAPGGELLDSVSLAPPVTAGGDHTAGSGLEDSEIKAMLLSRSRGTAAPPVASSDAAPVLKRRRVDGVAAEAETTASNQTLESSSTSAAGSIAAAAAAGAVPVAAIIGNANSDSDDDDGLDSLLDWRRKGIR